VPTLPKQRAGVVCALEDPDVKFDAVAELIEVDQALTSQTLRLANSAFYKTRGKVARVTHALVVLGATVTRSLVLASAVFDLGKVALRGFWEHSLGCAVAAGALAKVTGLVHPEVAAAAGLLHDLGKVVLYAEMPDAFDEILARAAAERRSFLSLEQELVGVEHPELAGWLAEKWGFPASLAEPIRFHHAPGLARIAATETAIVHVADALVRALGYGSGGDALVPPLDRAVWTRLGLTAATLDRALEVYAADLEQAANYALFE
jgi:putative nucleotidyltransferase with HDIG domain